MHIRPGVCIHVERLWEVTWPELTLPHLGNRRTWKHYNRSARFTRKVNKNPFPSQSFDSSLSSQILESRQGSEPSQIHQSSYIGKSSKALESSLPVSKPCPCQARSVNQVRSVSQAMLVPHRRRVSAAMALGLIHSSHHWTSTQSYNNQRYSPPTAIKIQFPFLGNNYENIGQGGQG